MQRADSLEKTVMLGKIEGGRGRAPQRMRWLDGIINSMEWVWVNSGSWWWTGSPGVLQSMGSQSDEHDWVTELNLHQVNKVLELQHQSFQWNIQGWFPLELTGLISLQTKRLSRVFFSTIWKYQFLVFSILYGPTLTSEPDYWKTHSFDDTDFCWQRSAF